MGVNVGRKSIRATISVKVGFMGTSAGGFVRDSVGGIASEADEVDEVESTTAFIARALLSSFPFDSDSRLSTLTKDARVTVARWTGGANTVGPTPSKGCRPRVSLASDNAGEGVDRLADRSGRLGDMGGRGVVDGVSSVHGLRVPCVS